MRASTYAELRRNLANELDRVTDDREPVIVTRGEGKPAVALISAEDFASYEETEYLLRSPDNARRLREAIAELEGGGGTLRELSAAPIMPA